jgi:hypothetical protein
MKNLSRHTDLLCEVETSLLIRGIQIGEMSKLGWLIGLVKHAIWANSLYFLYLLILKIECNRFYSTDGASSRQYMSSQIFPIS